MTDQSTVDTLIVLGAKSLIDKNMELQLEIKELKGRVHEYCMRINKYQTRCHELEKAAKEANANDG